MNINRVFIETPSFTKNWNELGLTEDDLLELQLFLLKDPKQGDEVPGVPGLRKVRFACKGHGKRGGARVIYVDVEIREKIHLIDVYSKNRKENLSEKEKKILAIIVSKLKGE